MEVKNIKQCQAGASETQRDLHQRLKRIADQMGEKKVCRSDGEENDEDSCLHAEDKGAVAPAKVSGVGFTDFSSDGPAFFETI